MNEEEKNNNHNSGFSFGLLLGLIAGAAGYFLFGTEKGKKVKKKLVKEGKTIWEEIESTVEESEIRTKEQNKPYKPLNSKETSPVVKIKSKVAEVKRFFLKNGRALKKK